MPTIGELAGADEHRRRRWITTTTGRLVVGDVTRSIGSWQRTVATLDSSAGYLVIGYENGTTQRIRSGLYVTVDGNMPHRADRQRPRRRRR